METVQSPWELLGVSESATDEQVKMAWRKLILKCHPDKAPEDQKELKAEEFKKVNEAYKTITEPELRRKYEDDKERRKRFADGGAAGSSYAGATPARHYNTRTAAPSSTYGAPRESTREYSRSPEDYYEQSRASSRKYDGYDNHYSSSKRDSPRTPRSSKESARMPRESEKASRSERRRREDRDMKRERSNKVHPGDSDSDERGQYEEQYHRRSEEQRNRERHAEESRRYEEARKSDDRKHARSRSDKHPEASAKYSYQDQEDEARDYISRSMHSSRPSYVRRSATSGESHVRRSSARRDTDRTPRERRRGSGPEIVDFPSSERVMPELKTSTSSPPNIKLRVPTERSSSDYPTEPKSAPAFRRSETMPTSRSRKDAPPVPSSKLRPDDSGYSSPTTPEYMQSPSAKYTYSYSPATGGVSLMDDHDHYRTVTREPELAGHRTSRSPIRPSRSSRYTSAPVTPAATPGRSSSYRYEAASSNEDLHPRNHFAGVRHTQPGSMRDNKESRNSDGRPLFGEVPQDSRPYFDPNKVSYTKMDSVNYGHHDARYTQSSNFDRPQLHRSSTYAY